MGRVPRRCTANGYAPKTDNGRCPLRRRLLGSTDDDHISRGSINSWDLSASVGSPVFAAVPGKVSYVDCFGYEQGRSSYHQGYGCAVDVNHGNGIVSQYAHCKQGTFYVKVGDQVTADSLLCQVGTTGQTSWPHVHFTILRNGSPIRIDSIFDIRQMHYCKFCRSTNDPNAPVVGMAGQTTKVQVASTPGQRLLRLLLLLVTAIGPEALTLVLSVLGSAILLFLWLMPQSVRVMMVAALVAGVCGIGTVLMFLPQGQVQAQGQTPGNFETAYKITVHEEGRGCDTHIVRTLHGVTQWTYDRYSKELGRPKRDVCTYLTAAESLDIYRRYYWQASGLDGVAMQAAIQIFDHSVNAGVGKGKAILATCGNDPNCVVARRRAFYNGTKDCLNKTVVCAAWLRRVTAVYNKAMSKGD
jgi:hypothetical protein